MTTPFDERHGWWLYQHPAFREVFDRLVRDVARIRAGDPNAAAAHPKAKLLKRIAELILDEIPRDPSAPEYRQGTTLGPEYRHWRRAKFLGRFRLFFRYSSKQRVIIYAWLNDENTLRKSGSKSDPYQVFARRLQRGDPPDDWGSLMNEARSDG